MGYQVEMRVEQELAVGNSFFKKKGINKYTWIRVANGRVIERALMDYVLIIIIITGFLFALSAYSFKHFEIYKRSKTVQKMQTTGYSAYSSRTVWSEKS